MLNTRGVTFHMPSVSCMWSEFMSHAHTSYNNSYVAIICSLFVSLVYCAESTVRWFVVREKHCWMAVDCADKSKRTGWWLLRYNAQIYLLVNIYIQIQNCKMQMKTPYIGIDKTCYYDMIRNLNTRITKELNSMWETWIVILSKVGAISPRINESHVDLALA
jgi:hypothetical protein